MYTQQRRRYRHGGNVHLQLPFEHKEKYLMRMGVFRGLSKSLRDAHGTLLDHSCLPWTKNNNTTTIILSQLCTTYKNAYLVALVLNTDSTCRNARFSYIISNNSESSKYFYSCALKAPIRCLFQTALYQHQTLKCVVLLP